VLPWSYDAEMGTANSLHASRNTASIMKVFLVLFLMHKRAITKFMPTQMFCQNKFFIVL